MSKQDLLTKLINDHEEVSEFLDNLREIMDFLHDKEAWDRITPVEDFFKRKVIDHFEFEEKNIFPVCLLNLASPELVKLILELQKDHGVILTKTEDFLRRATANIRSPNEETTADLKLKGKEILDILLVHASKEDDDLIPIIEKNKKIFSN